MTAPVAARGVDRGWVDNAVRLIEATHISRHGILLRVHFVGELLKTSVGKLNKRALREQFVQQSQG